MEKYNVYENCNMQDLLGETFRPGGFTLTDRAIEYCHFSKRDILLDLGCGCGASIAYLNRNYGIRGIGIDPSEQLLERARESYPSGQFIMGIGESLPFDPESFDGVLAECTLSLMDDVKLTMQEVYRVLKKDGCFIITDVYARRPSYITGLEKSRPKSCFRGLHDIDDLKSLAKNTGFEILYFEDCSNVLKELMVKIIFSYGSMGVFWGKVTGNCVDGEKYYKLIKSCKPGYFLMIVKKGGVNHG